jgi:hypothetical protein
LFFTILVGFPVAEGWDKVARAMVSLCKPVNLDSRINRQNNVRPRLQAHQDTGLLVPPYGLPSHFRQGKVGLIGSRCRIPYNGVKLLYNQGRTGR